MAANPHTEPDFVTAAQNQQTRKKSHLGFLLLVLVLGAALIGGVAYELSQRRTEERALAASTVAVAGGALPVVDITRVRLAPSEATVDVQGQTMALVETPIYARTDGYIKQRKVEMGDRVKQGQLMLELDTPDLDQQIEQAKATLAQSEASLAQLQANLTAAQSTLKLARVTAQRNQTLVNDGIISKQDNDTAVAAMETGEANVNAATQSIRAQQSLINANSANVKRLEDMKNYAHIEAPFDGVITYRNPQASDPGTLISAGSATSSAVILKVSQIQPLRVFVNVPQSYAPVIRVGARASLLVEEFPGRNFPAKVTSTTDAVDPASRTMLTVLQVDNSGGTLLPGMAVKARFNLPHTVNVLRLQAEGLLFRTAGPMAMVVGPDHKVSLHKLTLGRDYGGEVEVTAGLEAGDMVVLNPTDSITEGSTVELREKK